MGENMSQRHKVLSLLRHAGDAGVTNAVFLDWRIPRFSARICELREDGYEITTGAEHNSRVRYTLVSEPDVEGDRGGVSEGIPPLSEPGTSTVALDAEQPALFEVAPERVGHYDERDIAA
jgi:Helix-turn-helix domain